MRAFFVCVAIALFFLAWLASETAVQAYEVSYMPLSNKVLSRRISQKLLADPLEMGAVLNFAKTKIELGPFVLEAHGTDKAGKPWSYAGSSWNGSASIWSADLDKNGMEDLIILMPTGGCGGSTYQMLVLMFEKNGRPLPCVFDGYFEVDSHGVKDFVDLENNGHCQLIRQAFNDGYWLTSLYEAAGSRWHRLKTAAGIALPLYTRFTESPNHQAIHPPSFRHPFEVDLSNDFAQPLSAANPLYIDEIEWPKARSSEDPCFHFSDGRRSRPVAWYSTCTVVLDEKSGRRIATISASKAAHRLLSEISMRRIPVSICGARSNPIQGLSCEYIYAQSLNNNRQSAPPNAISMTRSLDAALLRQDNE